MHELDDTIRKESLRRLLESQDRIHRCAGLLNEAQLWYRPNGNTVSVGNLILHLAGNVGQWINSTLGARPDLRRRSEEFDAQGPMDRRALLEKLDAVLASAYTVIEGLGTKELVREWDVQGFRETGTGILLHVVEHFSYHTGQIALHTKLMRDIDTGFYAGQDLNSTGQNP